MLSFRTKIIGLFAILSLIYVIQPFILPPNPEDLAKYNLSVAQAQALTFTISVPYIFIWGIALMGYLRLRTYTDSIAGSKDGEAFRTISRGVLVLALWLPVSALAGVMINYTSNHQPEHLDAAVIFTNYLNLVILAIAFLTIYQGSRRLMDVLKGNYTLFNQYLTIAFIAFTAIYVFLTLQDPARQAATEIVDTATYYLPDWLTLLTVIIPRLVTWFLGLQAVYYIYIYSTKVKGIIYKNALKNLSIGVACTVVIVMALRIFQSLSTAVSQLSLAMFLIVIYTLLILIAIGYVLINRGARDLQKLESVE
jgi:hypothetical protein